jgi:UDP-2,4-diacetamido-2,4,6-trideoxy-beta-L-altropyranose hydrolase
MRCVALAEAAIERGHDAVLATPALPDGLKRATTRRGLRHETFAADGGHQAARKVAGTIEADWIVLDGYDVDAPDLEGWRVGRRLLFIDDRAALDRYPADLVLNQNAYATREAYAGRSGPGRLLLGPRFALLRSEFVAYADWRRSVATSVRRILVTMGGADPSGATGPVADALDGAVPGAEVVVVVGGGNPRADHIVERFGRRAGVAVLRAVDDMPALMAEADLAVATASTTAWELAYMQLPAAVFALADNQVAVAASLERTGAAISLGGGREVDAERLRSTIAALAADPDRRRAMAAAGRAMVDGRGAARVVRAMETAGVSLRETTATDAPLLYTWVNDPATRAASFHTEPIAWADHEAWIARRLVDADTLFFVATDGEPVGQVRFERTSSEVAVISVSVAPETRGNGYAPAIIDAGSRQAFETWPIERIRAEIRSENAASIAAFAEAGYGDAEALADPKGGLAVWLARPVAAADGGAG